MTRLSASHWTGYNRDQSCGVVHLGTGAFHRAHQAVYFDRLMAAGHPDWMIQGASLRSSRVSKQLNPQAGLYTVVTRAGGGEDSRLIGAIKHVIVAADDAEALIDAIAAPEVALITLTVTEKGYRPALANGRLMMDDPDVQHDLENPDHPTTALGFIAAGLAQRHANGAGPLTILSCDNMPDNGHAARRGVLAYAQARDPELAQWIETSCTFPSSMVDRIVPATTDADIDALGTRRGYLDRGMVKTEPFSQWVVEDNFAACRPPLETVDVTMTEDVAGWETAKLRLLNGAHSALAYLGLLAGHRFVHEAITAPGFADYIDALWDEVEATLAPLQGFDASQYRAALIERFRNASLAHQTYQIAMDGSQKLPQRFLATIQERQAQGLRSPALTLAVAAWMRWQTGVGEDGAAYVVDDPMADTTRRILENADKDPSAIVDGLMGLHAIFNTDLASDAAFKSAVTAALTQLLAGGAAKSVAEFGQNKL